jgi:hypothetical protein
MRLSLFLAAAVLAACSGGSNSSLSLSARSATTGAQPAAAATGIALTRVRVALEKIELRSRDGDRRAEIALGPVVIDLSGADLDGNVHRVFDSTVPAGTYDKIEFEIHPLERASTAAGADDLLKQHASAIIDGTIDGEKFSFATAIEAQQEFEGRFVVTDKSSNVTFDVDSSKWFVKDGARLDPRDAANRSAIEDNLRNSINAFQDDDGLGHENHDVDDDHGGDRDGGDDHGDGGNSGPGGGGGEDGGHGGGDGGHGGDDGSGHH